MVAVAEVKCKRCGNYVPLKGWPQSHRCGVPVKKTVNFKRMSHKQVLEYYCQNPEEIEKGLHGILKGVPIFRGRVDLIGRDTKECVCLIVIVHRSHYDRTWWIRKLWRYRNGLYLMAEQIFRCKRIKIRLLMKNPSRSTEDVTDTPPSLIEENILYQEPWLKETNA